MHVKFRVNLGHNDAVRLAIEPATEGQLAEVSDAAGAILVKRGWAEAVEIQTDETPKPTAKKSKANVD